LREEAVGSAVHREAFCVLSNHGGLAFREPCVRITSAKGRPGARRARAPGSTDGSTGPHVNTKRSQPEQAERMRRDLAAEVSGPYRGLMTVLPHLW
jgi:hypothetical protein